MNLIVVLLSFISCNNLSFLYILTEVYSNFVRLILKPLILKLFVISQVSHSCLSSTHLLTNTIYHFQITYIKVPLEYMQITHP